MFFVNNNHLGYSCSSIILRHHLKQKTQVIDVSDDEKLFTTKMAIILVMLFSGQYKLTIRAGYQVGHLGRN